MNINDKMIRKGIIFVLIAILPVILGWYIVGADKWDLSVPFFYGMRDDDIWQLLLTKGLVDNGWVLQNVYLGAPDIANWHYHSAAQTSALHSLIMTVMSYFIDDAIKIQQYYYFLNFSLISLSAYMACRLLKVSTIFSISIGLIFSFITYRINFSHYAFLSNYFMVPLAIVVITWCSLGLYTQERLKSRKKTVFQQLKEVLILKKFLFSVLVVCFVGISDGYYAFFTILLLGFSSILVVFIKRGYGFIESTIPLFFVGVIIIINIVVMSPIYSYKNANFEEFNPNGAPDPALVRHPMEAEVYSSSIKRMLAPIKTHRVGAVAEIGRWIIGTSDAARRLTVANSFFLGTVASVCLLFALMSLALTKLTVAKDSLLPNDEVLKRLRVFAMLSLFVMLCSISGGIGSIVALIFPTIRAYDRFPLFLIFLVLINFAFWLTFKLPEKKKNNIFTIVITVVITVFAIWDQTPASSLNSMGEPHVKRFQAEREFVKNIESQLTAGAMVYQYPFSQYLTDNKYYGWGKFDQMRVYLHSKQLRWSNGASKNSKVDIWHEELAKLPFNEIISQASLFGFEGVLIDRLVISDEEFEVIRKTIKTLYSIDVEVNENAKLAFFKFPSIGYKLLSNADYTLPEGIEIIRSEGLDLGSLPKYIDKIIFQELVNNSEKIFTFDEYPQLFDLNVFKLVSGKLNENINKKFLLGGLSCNPNEFNFSNLDTDVLNLRIHNNSDSGWRLNSGKKSITIGYHLYDNNNQLIEWDTGYRFNKVISVNSMSTEDVQISMADLGLDEMKKGQYSLEIELLQEGHAWFRVNSDNNVCHVQIKR